MSDYFYICTTCDARWGDTPPSRTRELEIKECSPCVTLKEERAEKQKQARHESASRFYAANQKRLLQSRLEKRRAMLEGRV